MRQRIYALAGIVILLTYPVVAAAAAPVSLGQVMSGTARLNGVTVPVGTTLVDRSDVATGSASSLIGLSSGQALRLNANSSISLGAPEAGRIEVVLTGGTVSYRSEEGSLTHAPAGTRVWFGQRQTGRPVTPQQRGVVAVLSQAASAGAETLVVNDAGQVNPARRILIKSADGQVQAIHYIQSIQGNQIVLTSPLQLSFPAQALIVQDEEEIAQAIASGAGIVGAASTTAATGTIATVGAGAGTGTGAGIAAIAAIGGIGAAGVGSSLTEEEAPASPVTP